MYYLSTSYLVIFFFFSSFNPIPCGSSSEGLGYCQTLFQCGNITAGFPFWGGNRQKDCGEPLLKLHCSKNNITSLFISNQEYSVLHIDQTSNTLTLAKQDLLGSSFCSSVFTNTSLPQNNFELLPTYKSVNVFYNCSSLPQLSSYTCPEIGPISVSDKPEFPETCNASFTLNVPSNFATTEKMLNLTNLESVLRKGFEVKAKTDEESCQECLSSRGRCHGFNENLTPGGAICRPPSDSEGTCGYNQTSRVFVCYCKDPYSLTCSHKSSITPWIIGGVTILILIGIFVSLFIRFRTRFSVFR